MLGFITVNDMAGAANRLLADTATRLQAQGWRLAGAVQDNLDRGPDRDCDMDLRILGEADGLPALPQTSIVLLRNPQQRSPVSETLAEYIVEGFRL